MGVSSSKPSVSSSNKESNATNGTNDPTMLAFLVECMIDGALLYGAYVVGSSIFEYMKQSPRFTGKAKTRLQQRLKDKKKDASFQMNAHECIIAGDLVDPDDLVVTFDRIGGLEHQKRELYELVVLPLKHPELFKKQAKLLATPKGIMLYGQPGTGKTMLAKAIAKESGAMFIDLKMSTIMSKWVGESQKLVHATFTLARKLAPCIIFIDEIDTFMGARGGLTGNSGDHVWNSMRTEFMALWDGMSTNENTGLGYGVVVLGATNRPNDVDPAFLRRMPRSFEIDLPSCSQREKILHVHLHNENVQFDMDLSQVAQLTEGYSGSDLMEVCRAALMIPLREVLDQYNNNSTKLSTLDLQAKEGAIQVRPVTLQDFRQALQICIPTSTAAQNYESRQNPQSASSIDLNNMLAALAAFSKMFSTNSTEPFR